jgi:hypothetical protein
MLAFFEKKCQEYQALIFNWFAFSVKGKMCGCGQWTYDCAHNSRVWCSLLCIVFVFLHNKDKHATF